MGNEIGDMVLKLAKNFVIARRGYSYLTVENRKKIGKSRFQLQELNAEINNKAVVSNKNTVQIPSNTFVNDIPHHSWINKDSLLKQYINDDVIIAIDGIKPMSGFCLNLIYNKNNKLALRVIDLHGPKGKKKLTGKLYANLINVQKHLPAYSRFEINEDGLFLTLPNEWLQLESIKDNLISLFATIKPLGFEQKSSKFIFYK